MAKRRKSGEGMIRKRADGRWEGRIVIGYDEKNLPITKNVTAKTKRECVEKLNALKESLGKSTEKIRVDMTFGEWLDFWYQTYSKPALRPTTQAGYENHIYKHILPTIGKIPLQELTASDLQQFYANLKKSGRLTRADIYGKGLSDRSVRACHACCRTALDKAVSEKLIRKNPAIECKLPPKRDREMQVLTAEEMRRVLIQAREEGYYEMLLLDLSTGMRRGELLALQWEDIDFETGAVRIDKQVQAIGGELIVSPPKTKSSSRTVLLPPPLLAIFREYRKTVNSRWVFPSPVKEDSPRDPTTCRKRLSAILEHAGCKHVRFHDLRHTFSTQAIQYGMDVKTLAATLGHSSVETTLNVYSHVTDEMQKSAARKIDAMFGASATNEDVSTPQDKVAPPEIFEPYKGKRRKPGTGCVTQINEHLWEGRYAPKMDGKRTARCVYAETETECEVKLAELIRAIKAQ